MPKNIPCEYKGEEFSNLKDLANAKGISYGTLYSRIRNQRLSVEEAVDKILWTKNSDIPSNHLPLRLQVLGDANAVADLDYAPKTTQPIVLPDGTEFKSLKQLAEKYHIKYHRVIDAIKEGTSISGIASLQTREYTGYKQYLPEHLRDQSWSELEEIFLVSTHKLKEGIDRYKEDWTKVLQFARECKNTPKSGPDYKQYLPEDLRDKSWSEIEELFLVSTHRIKAGIKLYKNNWEKVLQFARKDQIVITDPIPLTFKSMDEFAKAINVSHPTTFHMITKQGVSPNELYAEFLSGGVKPRRGKRVRINDTVSFDTLQEFYNFLGISKFLYKAQLNLGLTNEQIYNNFMSRKDENYDENI